MKEEELEEKQDELTDIERIDLLEQQIEELILKFETHDHKDGSIVVKI